jgi:hypothetical protein
MVSGSLSASSSETGLFHSKDSPKSPCRTMFERRELRPVHRLALG